MHVEYALYGDRSGAHSLIWSTFQDRVVEKALQITDLAWGLPNSLGTLPMYRCRPIDQYYVVVKTVRDSDASRSGMASSVAAFFGIEEASSEDSFQYLIGHLPTPSPRLKPPPFENSQDGLEHVALPVDLQPLVHVLFDRNNAGPVVWIGMENVIEVVSSLWSRLPIQIRRSFAFACVCDPGDGNISDCTMVYCPKEVAGRWSGSNVVNSKNSSLPPPSIAEKYLLNTDDREAVNKTISQLGADIATLSDLRTICQCHESFSQLSAVSTLDAAKLARNVAVLSPDSSIGRDVKRPITQNIYRRIESEGTSAIALIRNIDFGALDSSSKNIADACRTGILNELNKQKQDVKPVAELVTQATEQENLGWAVGVLEGMRQFVKSNNKTAKKVWELLQANTKLLLRPDIFFPAELDVDDAMASTAPSTIGSELKSSLIQIAQQRNQPQLHAVCLSQDVEVSEAIESICKSWNGEARTRSLKQLIERNETDDFLACVNARDEPEIIEIASAACIDEPNKFESFFSPSSRSWQRVFVRVVDSSPSVVENSDVESILTDFQEGLSESRLESDYQLALSKTKYANLIDMPDRADVWMKIDASALEGFLRATALAWIDAVHLGASVTAPEQVLLDAILDRNIRNELLPTSGENALQRVIHSFDAIPRLSEQNFEQWRQGYLGKHRSLSKVDALQLGDFVQRRDWVSVASKLADDVNWYRRSDLRPAVSKFLSLLGWVRRWHFGESDLVVSKDEWWDEFRRTLISLYPEGPSSLAIWERGGGDVSDLITDGTGAEQWQHCLRRLRNGFKSGKLTTKTLVKSVAEDYSNNSTVKVLVEARPK